ncbi:MAG: cytochrome c3 family protein, partial [Thermodesulfovibrionales bacterium]
MKRFNLIAIAALALCFSVTAPNAALAVGAHDSFSCTGCHSIHDAKGNIIFAIPANTKDVNAKTKKPFTDITALCLGCHQSPEKGGMGINPISQHVSHPFGIKKVNSKIASVPDSLLRSGKFECISCHDPHPSNPNYKYLRAATSNGSDMQNFCIICHRMKADPTVAAKKVKIF